MYAVLEKWNSTFSYSKHYVLEYRSHISQNSMTAASMEIEVCWKNCDKKYDATDDIM